MLKIDNKIGEIHGFTGQNHLMGLHHFVANFVALSLPAPP
jgi:hypothetical protein